LCFWNFEIILKKIFEENFVVFFGHTTMGRRSFGGGCIVDENPRIHVPHLPQKKTHQEKFHNG
jgi:hypothetical protein